MIPKLSLKLVKSLQIKKFRTEHGLFLVEGRKSVFELLESPLEVRALFCTMDFYQNYTQILKSRLPILEYLTDAELEKISSMDTNGQIIAVAKIPNMDAIDFDVDQLIVLDSIQDPGNLGTIIRVADWFGFNQVICSKTCVDSFNPKSISATMGSFTRVTVHYQELSEVIAEAKKYKFQILGAMLDGQNVTSVDFKKALIVFGSESHGIGTEVAALLDQKVTIKGFGMAESLNAGVSCGIILHQATQQA